MTKHMAIITGGFANHVTQNRIMMITNLHDFSNIAYLTVMYSSCNSTSLLVGSMCSISSLSNLTNTKS